MELFKDKRMCGRTLHCSAYVTMACGVDPEAVFGLSGAVCAAVFTSVTRSVWRDLSVANLAVRQRRRFRLELLLLIPGVAAGAGL
eukprot:6186027-Pleurochrysis_carterae.AAC.1